MSISLGYIWPAFGGTTILVGVLPEEVQIRSEPVVLVLVLVLQVKLRVVRPINHAKFFPDRQVGTEYVVVIRLYGIIGHSLDGRVKRSTIAVSVGKPALFPLWPGTIAARFSDCLCRPIVDGLRVCVLRNDGAVLRVAY